ncbi:glycosyltransferase [Acinetobacter bereziniae]|uniref:glycosyltransferase n=1 Tax=Acinetobacter bereziniae TaxID=106648 RepID=UPI003AF44A6F
MNILHISPEWNWSRIFVLPIIIKQAEINKVWLSTPNCDDSSDDLYTNIKFVSWNKKYNKFLKYLLSVFFIISKIREKKIEYVYAHTTVDSTLYILGVRLFTSAKITYINHGVPYIGYNGFLKTVFKFIEIININFSNEVITITKSMKEYLTPLNKTAKEIKFFSPGTLVGVKMTYNSFSEVMHAREKAKSLSNNIIRIIYVGRLEERKGIYELIKAINSTTLDCELSILGGTADQVNIEFNQSKVKFLGFQSDLSSYYLQADLLCVPSHHEGFGQVYLEASSYGVIPICCNIPGPTDFIQHGFNGFVVEPKSPESILNLFDKIKKRKFDLEALRNNAFNSSLKYERSLVIDNNMEFFK